MVCLRLIGIRKLAVAPDEPVSHPADLAVPSDCELHVLTLPGALRVAVECEPRQGRWWPGWIAISRLALREGRDARRLGKYRDCGNQKGNENS